MDLESEIHPAHANPVSLTTTLQQPHSMSRLRLARKSAFQELDVDTMFTKKDNHARASPSPTSNIRPSECIRSDSESSDISENDDESAHAQGTFSSAGEDVSSTFSRWIRPTRLSILAFALLIVIPLIYDTPLLGKAGPSVLGVKAGVIGRSEVQNKAFVEGELVVPRDNTNIDVCNRWSQQSAIINGTIYLYGGHATTQQGQTSNTWNNDFLTLDVTKSWDISSPSIKGLPQPSGPPPVSNGYLWNSYDSLFLYGGEFSDRPKVTPTSYSLWQYNIASSSWTEHQNPQTSAGNNSDPANQPVQRAAEGAGVSVPQLGRGWYFAGHLDEFTTPGWSNQVFRVYLKSLLEYTFPGYTNNGVQSLSGGKTSGSDGTWRNITQGGIQDTATFPNRADSVLVYVPGYGAQGILVSMGGGTNISYVSLCILWGSHRPLANKLSLRPK